MTMLSLLNALEFLKQAFALVAVVHSRAYLALVIKRHYLLN